LDFIIVVLQEGSAWSTHMICAMFGVPVLQEGVRLTVPGLTVEVAQECSSIRSSSILVVTAVVMAEILLHSSWRKALLIAIAIPLSVIKNGVRIFAIAMLGTRVDPGYLTGRLHHDGGVVFLAMALLALAGILWVLRKGEKRPLPSQSVVSTGIVAGD
jgi:exosortase